MPKKLTVLGVLAAVALGTFGVLQDSAQAGPSGPAQNFSVNADICYGTAPDIGAICSGTSNTAAPANSSAISYSTARVDYGSRLTLPISFVPGDSSGVASANGDGFGYSPPGAGSSIGEVTARVDIGCDDTANDILSPSAGVAANWPSGWSGYDLLQQAVPPSYVDHPFNWTIIGDAEAELTTLWAGGTVFVPITPDPIPLNVAIGASPYKTGLRASVAQLGGDPSAPGSYLCQDSPQDSSTDNNTGITPTTPGIYATWTIYTSAVDFADWTVSRIIDVQCVDIGNSGGSLAPCSTDSDGDGLVDIIETESGTSTGSPDTDGDGATDREEMFNGTRPSTTSNGFVANCAPVADPDGAGPEIGVDSAFSNAEDTDCDGQKDVADNGADQTVASKGTIEDTNTDDNCPAVYNASQLNSDSPRFAPNAQPLGRDTTDPQQDLTGDACDTDDDNDSMDDVVEVALTINPAPLAGTSFCSTTVGGGYAASPAGPTDDDSDNDGGLDGVECRHLKNPKDAGSRMAAGFVATEGDAVINQRRFYRSYRINSITPDAIDAADERDDTDSDGTSGSTDADSDTNASNGKVDGQLDAVEVKFYGTRTTDDDSDNDNCGDGAEMADVNGNRNIDVIDLGIVAGNAGSIRNIAGELDQLKQNSDFNKNGTVDVIDLGAVAGHVQNCVAQAGVTVNYGPSPQP